MIPKSNIRQWWIFRHYPLEADNILAIAATIAKFRGVRVPGDDSFEPRLGGLAT